MLLLRSVVSFWLQFFGIWLFSPSLETVRNYFSPLASWSFTTMCHGLSHFSSEIFNQKKHIIFDTLSSFSSLIFPPHHFICFLFLVLLLLKHWTLWTESLFKKKITSCSSLVLWRWQPSPTSHHGCPPTPVKPKIVTRRTKKVIWHQSDRWYVKITRNWQKPRGTDNRVQRRFKDQIVLSNAGYGSNRKTKHILPGGLQKFLVPNVKETEVLLMCNKSHCAEIAHISSKTHNTNVERAAQLPIRVTSPNAGLHSEEKE